MGRVPPQPPHYLDPPASSVSAYVRLAIACASSAASGQLEGISAETTPNLWRLASRGVFFAHHHPVFCSATEVNGTAIATGAYPEHSFVIANVDFRPRIDPQNHHSWTHSAPAAGRLPAAASRPVQRGWQFPQPWA